jgi:integrase
MRVLDITQSQRFLEAAGEHRLGMLFHLAITTGLRQGELLGLQWSDLDWKTGRLQIRRQLQRIPGQGLVLTEPKSARGRRSITLASVDLAKLRENRKRRLEERLFAGGAWHESDLIFSSRIGTPMDPSNLVHVFKSILKKANLPDI